MTLVERVFNNGQPTDKIEKVEFSKIKNGVPIEVYMSMDDMNEISNLSSVEQKKEILNR